MKIGVITWFTGPNYGTNLQAIALQYYLNSQGHDTCIINYEVPAIQSDKPKSSILEKILNQPKKYIGKYINYKYKDEILSRDNKMIFTMKKMCTFTHKIYRIEDLINICNNFDLIICGSDQIWNPNWYNRFYYADYEGITTRKISYAPSMGVNSIPENIIPSVKRSIKNFEMISVREIKAATLLEPYLNYKPKVVVDPTLLLSNNEWNDIFSKRDMIKEEYVFAFFLDDESTHLKATINFAKKLSIKLIMVPYKGTTYLQKAEIHADAGVEEMLDLIRNASFIITDSFHITVFSIIFKKQFYTFERFKEDRFTSQNSRVINLLEMSDLKCRLLPFMSKQIDYLDAIEYNNISTKLLDNINSSKDFLKEYTEER